MTELKKYFHKIFDNPHVKWGLLLIIIALTLMIWNNHYQEPLELYKMGGRLVV